MNIKPKSYALKLEVPVFSRNIMYDFTIVNMHLYDRFRTFYMKTSAVSVYPECTLMPTDSQQENPVAEDLSMDRNITAINPK